MLGNRDLENFKDACLHSLLIIGGIVATKSARVYCGKTLIVGWRRRLCLHLHKLYLADNSSYKLIILDEDKLDNPDQRMTSDVSSVVESYGGVVSDLVLVPFITAYYTYEAYRRAGWLGPTVCYVYFIISTTINKFLMSPVVRLTASKEQKEGDFRFKHMELRSRAESLAMSGSVRTELDRVNQKMLEVCGVQQTLYNRSFPIDLSVNLFQYLGAIVSYLVIAVPIFSGVYDDKEPSELAQIISETAFVCMYLVYQLGLYVSVTSKVASLAGSTHRVAELIERLTEINKSEEEELTEIVDDEDTWSEDSRSELMKESEDIVPALSSEAETVFFRLEGVSFKPPGWEKNIISDLSLTVMKNCNLLIMGQSGCGKSSLVRVLRGVWPHSGQLEVTVKEEDLLYLSQTPFLSSGSLLDLVTYPAQASSLSEDDKSRVLSLMSLCQLSSLVSRYEEVERDSWYTELSPGEQQRLAWARLLHHQPRLAVLDEATSAVSEELETVMYSEAGRMGMTLVSVGHRASLRQYHHHLLLIGQDGDWRLGRVRDYDSQNNLFVTNTS